MKKIWLLLVLIVLSSTLTACADGYQPTEVARRYLEAVRDANYSVAYDLLTADSQLKISKADFSDRLTKARQDSNIIKIEVTRINREMTVIGKRASVTYQLDVTLQNGQKIPLFESMVMLEQDSGWRVIWPPQ